MDIIKKKIKIAEQDGIRIYSPELKPSSPSPRPKLRWLFLALGAVFGLVVLAVLGFYGAKFFKKTPVKQWTIEEVNKLPQTEIPADKIFASPQKDFRAGEEVKFKIQTPENVPKPVPRNNSQEIQPPRLDQRSFLPEKLQNFWGVPKVHAQTTEIVRTEVIGPDGKLTDIVPVVQESSDGTEVSLPPPGPSFVPGQYQLKVYFLDGKDLVLVSTQDFTWGVLALNIDQSVYLPDSEAFMAMAVLDDKGEMVCDAKVALSITDPDNRETVLTTEKGEISVSPECASKELTSLPDYYARYKMGGAGAYRLKLTAETGNGLREITDELNVEEDPAYIIRREGPTRIYPPNAYAMTMEIEARRDFRGAVIETTPDTFSIGSSKVSLKKAGADFADYNARFIVEGVGSEKKIIWENIDLKAGETLRIKYNFHAPNVSPDMHLIGRAQLVDAVKTAEIPPAPAPSKVDLGAFEIERNGPTPTDQPGIYQMVTKVRVKEDSNAYLADLLPSSFDVKTERIIRTTTTEQDGKISVTKQLIRDMDDPSPIDAPININSLGEAGIHEIVWQVPWKAGETYDLMYQFDPRNFNSVLVPDFLKFAAKNALFEPIDLSQFDLGRLNETNQLEIGSIIYEESRFWQIAADATTSAKYPGTAVNDTSIGTIGWTSPQNVGADDTSYATVGLTDNQVSRYIKATNFGFTTSDIPSGYAIDGITVNVRKWASTASRIGDRSVKIVKGGTIQGNEGVGSTAPNWPNTETTSAYGSGTEKWGLTWNSTDITSGTGFGVAFAAIKSTTATALYTGSVDWITLTVSYSLPTPPAPADDPASVSLRTGVNLKPGVSLLANCAPLIDSRDGKIYATVQIGYQCWMRKGLNVGTRVNGASAQGTTCATAAEIEKWCYSDSDANCDSDANPRFPDGGLYQWDQAMCGASTCNGTGESQPACSSPVQGICPSGWHIPSHYELTALERAVCTSGSCATDFPYDIVTTGYRGTNEGTKLKPNGTSGFEGNLAGYYDGGFLSRTTLGFFWSSTETSASDAWIRLLSSGSAQVSRYSNYKPLGFAVRCAKD